MHTVYLFAAIGTLLGFVFTCNGGVSDVELIFGGVLGGLLGCMIGMLFAIALSCLIPTHEVVYPPATLKSMRSADRISGTFIFGSGSIGRLTSYNFMIKMSDGSIRPASVPANSLVAIIEDESLTNVGYWTTTRREANPSFALHKWGFGSFSAVVRHEFRVPIGTVVQT